MESIINDPLIYRFIHSIFHSLLEVLQPIHFKCIETSNSKYRKAKNEFLKPKIELYDL